MDLLLGCLMTQTSCALAAQVFKEVLGSVDDVRMDFKTWKKCQDDAKRLCTGVKPHHGRLQVRSVLRLLS